MARKEFTQISDDQIRAASIASLADKPNTSSNYGTGNLTAEDLKKRFDAFPNLVKDRINKIIEVLSTSEAGKYITLPDNTTTGKDNLYDFIELFTDKTDDKDCIADFIYVLFQETPMPLSSAIKFIWSDISSIGTTQDTMYGTVYALESKVNTFSDKLQKGEDALTKTTAVEKRVTNLESQVNKDLIVTDSSIAYAKEVPARSAPYAEITKFGGMSYNKSGTLHHAKPTAFKSIGQNHIPFPYDFTGVDESNFKISIDNEQRLVVSGVPTSDKSYKLKEISLPVGNYFVSAIQTSPTTRICLYKNGTLIWSHASTDSPFAFTVDNTSDVYKIEILALANNTFNNDVIAPMISKDVASSYKPYRESTLAIPTAVQNIDGYGYGVNANAYNYVDWVDKKYHKVLSTANIGSYDWIFGGYYAYPNVSNFAKPNGACIANVSSNIKEYYINDSGVPVFIFNEGDYANVDEVKSAMQGVMLVYELATPEVIDIPDLPDDNLIAVEGGGTIIAVNKYEYAVPSEITYQLRSAT